MRAPVDWLSATLRAVVPAKAGTHNHRLWNMGPRLRGDDNVSVDELDHE
jgi:hypothetical protein